MRNGRGGRAGRAGRIGFVVVLAVVLAGCQIELGSVSNTFGNDPTVAGGTTTPQIWGSINGPYSDLTDGDPFATKCGGDQASATSCDAAGANPTYVANGYTWSVDVPAADVGTTITVSLYDPALDPGDAAGDSDYTGSLADGFATSYHLFHTTGNATDQSTDPSLGMDTLGMCSGGTPGYQVFPASTVVQTSWVALCTFVPSTAGIYPLQVKTSAIPGLADSGGGWNQFSIKAVSSGATQPLVASLEPMSVYVSTAAPPPHGSMNEFTQWNLVDVGAQHAGQILTLDVFDLGDGSGPGPNTVQILSPPSGPPLAVPTGGNPVACSFSDPTVSIAGSAIYQSPTCTITTQIAGSTPVPYSGKWLRIQVALPPTYTCTVNCWWQVRQAFDNLSARATDRSVWSVTFQNAPASTAATRSAGRPG
jgi:hypothetical protein